MLRTPWVVILSLDPTHPAEIPPIRPAELWTLHRESKVQHNMRQQVELFRFSIIPRTSSLGTRRLNTVRIFFV